MMETTKTRNQNYIYLITVGATAAFMLVVWIATECITGKNSLIIIDGLHQYMPYFADYQEKLRNGSSLFYSFKEGLGTNFLCLWSYYLSSPLNLLILLVSKEHLNTMVSFIVTLKILISSFTFVYMLLHRPCYKRRDLSAVPLAVGYAISSYVIGYYWNVMWMDCIMVFPLIILGYDYLVEKKDARLYILSLFYALVTNYYIGFIICIFLVLWAVFYPYKSFKQLLGSAGRFTVSSLLSGGLGAIVLLPAYMGISSTASAKRVLPSMTQYGSYIDQLQRMFIGTEPINNQVDDAGVNLYCGVFTILFFGVYLISKEFSISEKARYLLYFVILAFSFNTELLNYIWHGFHNQYGIPNRFSFLFIFLMLLVAYDVLAKYKEIHKTAWIVSGMLGILFCGACYVFADTKLPKVCYILTIVLLFTYAVLAYVASNYERIRKPIYIAMVGTMFVEVLAAGGYDWGQNGIINLEYYYSETEEMQEIREELALEDPGFYRMEIANSKMLDEATWHGLNCVTMFGSTARGDMVRAMGRLGFYTGANEYLFCGETPLTSALMSNKYVMLRKDDYNNFQYDYYNTYGDCFLYKNPQWLPVGICMEEAMTELKPVSTFFHVQNQVAMTATGVEEPIFTEKKYDWDATGTACTVTTSSNQINYTVTGDEKPKVQASLEMDEDMDLYVDISGGNVRQVRLYVNGSKVAYDRYQNQAFHVGSLSKGQTVMLELEFNEGATEGGITLHTAQFHREVWDRVYKQLQTNTFDPEIYEDGYMKGKVTAEEGQVLFLSIPEDAGWKIKVDGQEVESVPILDAFLGIPLTAGEHEIEMYYVSPGFRLGALVTLASMVPVGLMFVFIGLRRKKERGLEREEENHQGSDSGSGTGDKVPSGHQGDSEGDAAHR